MRRTSSTHMISSAVLSHPASRASWRLPASVRSNRLGRARSQTRRVVMLVPRAEFARVPGSTSGVHAPRTAGLARQYNAHHPAPRQSRLDHAGQTSADGLNHHSDAGGKRSSRDATRFRERSKAANIQSTHRKFGNRLGFNAVAGSAGEEHACFVMPGRAECECHVR